MKIDYSKYINKLKTKRENSPYWQAFRRSLSSVSNDTRSIRNTMSGRMDKAGGSVAAIAQAEQESQSDVRKFNNSMFADMSEKDTARTDEIDSRIEQLQFSQDEQNRAEAERLKAERNAKRSGLGKAAIQIGTTMLGAGIGVASAGTLAPISAALIGGSIGGGIGQMAGSFVGGSGKMAINHLNPEEFMMGFQDTARSVSSALTLSSQKSDLSSMTELLKSKNLSVTDIIFLQEFLKSGDLAGAKQYLGGI